jgi:hypothetical protein
MWSSDSDDNDCTESKQFSTQILIKQENKEELKRKQAIETNEKQVLNPQYSIVLNANRWFRKSDINRKLEPDEHWYCPKYEPPLPSDLNDSNYTINNAPIVKYFRKNKKFHVVSLH